MHYLGFDETELELSGGINTAKEISGQPDLWRDIAKEISNIHPGIKAYLETCLDKVDSIILTGAGTSAYVGISLEGLYYRKFKKRTIAVPTTSIVTHPEDYFSADSPVLLISFARSGNSPESIATVELADKVCNKCYHLIITCDENGALAKYNSRHSKYLFVLPPESNDKSLAMTGSYSGMLLTGILLAWINNIDSILPQVETICSYGEKIVDEYSSALLKIAKKPFERAVFLGSGPYLGTATESHLKLQELTDGTVMCTRESFLGLRHGPKAVVHNDTLVVYIFSKNSYTLSYEKDLALAVAKEHNPVAQIAISEKNIDLKFDLMMCFSDQDTELSEELLSVCYVLPGQILGFYKSLALDLKPDNPSVSNVISRVVEGVKIYDYKIKEK